VVARVRRILKTKRVGHTGTLDPFATGVMVVLVGKATRLAQFLDKDEKEYEAVVQFGFETETGDITGVRSAGCGLRNEEITQKLGEINWEKVLSKFRGEIMQTPPMYSAKKIEGKRLYEFARKGVEIEREPVNVTIHELEILEVRSSQSEIRINVVCSAGTYIRTLAEDIGRAVELGAHLTELRRTRAGRFGIEQSITLDALDALENPESVLLPLRDAVSHLPVFELKEDRVGKTKSGMSTRVYETWFEGDDAVQMIDPSGELIAIGYFDEGEKSVQPKVVLG
jgi:tRNA pseudouridine55 synthase